MLSLPVLLSSTDITPWNLDAHFSHHENRRISSYYFRIPIDRRLGRQRKDLSACLKSSNSLSLRYWAANIRAYPASLTDAKISLTMAAETCSSCCGSFSSAPRSDLVISDMLIVSL